MQTFFYSHSFQKVESLKRKSIYFSKNIIFNKTSNLINGTTITANILGGINKFP